jgi:D-sedoheptulose 7-phosphate isomerase
MDSIISNLLSESAALKAKVAQDAGFVSSISKSAALLYETIRSGGTILACGNGGSTCDAMHLVEELVARYKRDRAGIKAMHFADPSTLTCWSNDVGFEDAYRRYAEVFCGDKDVLIAISTSGNSKNIIAAAKEAKKRGCKVVGLAGKDGGALRELCDITLVVPSNMTERIQEVHITIVHIWLELLETEYAVK